MALFKNKFRIESTRLTYYDYSNAGLYFITIVTKNRNNYFGQIINNQIVPSSEGIILFEEWTKTTEIRNNIMMDYFTIMPNHFHGIIIITDKRVKEITKPGILKPDSLSSIIGQIKSKITKRIRASVNPEFQWQKGFYEHIIRNEKSLFNIRTYIENNPRHWDQDPENGHL